MLLGAKLVTSPLTVTSTARLEIRLCGHVTRRWANLLSLMAANGPLRASCNLSGVLAQQLVGCNVYVSEGQRAALLQQLKDIIQAHKGVALITSFIDPDYNRSSFMLASTSTQQLCSVVAEVAHHTLLHVDMTKHRATHPRLGAVDHISCHPVTPATSMSVAAETARAVAARLSQPPGAVPVYLYGAAHPQGRTLAELRRQMGYFKSGQRASSGVDNGVWSGIQLAAPPTPALSPSQSMPPPLQDLPVPPDMGPLQMSPATGVSTIGAVPWLLNYNVPLITSDLAAGKRIARAVSQRGGGLPAVEAMALHKGDVVEVACNLLDPQVSTPAIVFQLVQQLAASAGLKCAAPYQINLSADDVALRALSHLT